MTKIFDDFKHYFWGSSHPRCMRGEFLPVEKDIFKKIEQEQGFIFPQDFKDLYSITNGFSIQSSSLFLAEDNEFEILGIGFITTQLYGKSEITIEVFPDFLRYLPTGYKDDLHIYSSSVEYFYPGSPDSHHMAGFWENVEHGKQVASLNYKDWPPDYTNDWFEGWYPEKKYEYINIGETYSKGEILLGVKENTYGKVYYWNYPEKERDAPTLVADSLYEFLARLQVVYDD